MKKFLLLYPLIVGICLALTWLVLEQGKDLHIAVPQTEQSPAMETVPAPLQPKPVVIQADQTVWGQFLQNFKRPLALLLLQVVVILACSRLMGVLFLKLGQPSVVGEIIAGIMLGPSLMGYLFPDFSAFLFPPGSLRELRFLSQIGLAFFMFIIGMELDLKKIRLKAHNALLISHSSIAISFLLGCWVSLQIYGSFSRQDVPFTAFALFMGVAMSITAFPVLARILQERKLTRSPLGNMALTCAAIDDLTAWCLLATVIAIVKAGSLVNALFTIVLALGFVALMIGVVRPWIRHLSVNIVKQEGIDKTVMAVTIFILLLSAYFAEIIGIHMLFGAFLAGVVMPHNAKFKERLSSRLEDISLVVLLPIFFAVIGLRTRIGLLNEPSLWIALGLVILLAVTGKFAGSTLVSRMLGNSWKDSVSIGALMNTRGLMELVVLNIGYDLGILSPEVFVIMVLMALSTTFMTGPLLNLINYLNGKRFDRRTVAEAPAAVDAPAAGEA